MQPSAESASQYLHQQGAEEYARWFLAVDPGAPEDSPARYQWPIGDFKSLHRSGLVAARDQAYKHGAPDIAEAADDVLFIFDRLTAC